MRPDRPLAPFVPCLLCLIAVFLGPVAAAGWTLAAFHPDPLSASRPKLLMWLATVAGQSLCWALLLAWMAPRLGGSPETLVRQLPCGMSSRRRRSSRSHGWSWRREARGPTRSPGIEIRPGWLGAIGLIVAELGICGVFPGAPRNYPRRL